MVEVKITTETPKYFLPSFSALITSATDKGNDLAIYTAYDIEAFAVCNMM